MPRYATRPDDATLAPSDGFELGWGGSDRNLRTWYNRIHGQGGEFGYCGHC